MSRSNDPLATSTRYPLLQLIQAIQAQGMPIDPRIWLLAADVIGLPVFGDESVRDRVITVPVRLVHNRVKTHAYMTGDHGLDHGQYWPYDIDDTVLLGVEYADRGWGLKILARWWDAGTPAPALVRQHIDAPCIVVPAGRTLRIEVRDGGRLEVFERPPDGQEPEREPFARKSDVDAEFAKVRASITKLETHTHTALGAGTTPPQGPSPGPNPVPPPNPLAGQPLPGAPLGSLEKPEDIEGSKLVHGK